MPQCNICALHLVEVYTVYTKFFKVLLIREIEMITAISPVMVMNSYCSAEYLLCERVLSPGLFRCNRVCNLLSHHKPRFGTDAHTQIVQAHQCAFKHTCTHTPGTLLQLGVPCRAWLRGFVPLLSRLCQVPPHMCNSAHTHIRAKIKSTHTFG